MQYFSSLLLFSVVFVAISANRPRICLNNGAPCNANGTLGNCCSTNCVVEPGQSRGRCRTRGRAARQTEQCLDNEASCQQDGSQNNCCSGFCLQQEDNSEGTCQMGPEVGIRPLPVQPVSECLFNGASCQMDGSQGNCCSGFCLQQEEQNEGRCQEEDKETDGEEGEEVEADGEWENDDSDGEQSDESNQESKEQEKSGEENSQEQEGNEEENDEE